jgi:polyphosphate glucokinase
VIDIGGEGTKMMLLDARCGPLTPRIRQLTPQPATPQAVMDLLSQMVHELPSFDRVSVGFPGVVVRGEVLTAPNLGTDVWRSRNLAADIARLTGRPTRVLNDADLQGYGVITGSGVEMVLTLGTGLGTALYAGGRLVPNLELGHHPFRKNRTYEERVCKYELDRIGKKRWSRRVAETVEQLAPIWNYDTLYIGGGNARKIQAQLPSNVRIFTNVDGMTGGVHLWRLDDQRDTSGDVSLPSATR